ncbi:protein-L-isoaspartate(D-aspartate) O-methyltransferase [Notoacmeibacter marinus]|uniref:protein-L-isoaspartate(D-aspartate) O-methyltransferase n=1 Tax=Notoacmeibacter marinus TaxID=1876515 RepID=UPI000DF39969|nr:protein-L-isoaspartate(D-aspartate) O-methyltransferase [Notoacmeibacter marinus]
MSCETDSDLFARRRHVMVERQLNARGIADPAVLKAMAMVPREAFVPLGRRAEAYDDHPLPIGHGQTISQPFMVAFMMEAARLTQDDRVLEVGLGSGYGAAVASRIVRQVYGIERHKELADGATMRLDRLGYRNVCVRIGDGTKGWPDEAPFDAIIISAAAQDVSPTLFEQLAPGGRLVAPIGPARGAQTLMRFLKDADGYLSSETLGAVAFVPLVLDD